jgi:hypothetical protein
LKFFTAGVIEQFINTDYTQEDVDMDRYLVISPHTDKDCATTLKQMLYIGYITHFDWGCMDGDHTGWAIIEAKTSSEALLVVPPTQRSTARAVKLNKFSPADVDKMHSSA